MLMRAPRCCFCATHLVAELPRSNGQTTAWPSAPSRAQWVIVEVNAGERPSEYTLAYSVETLLFSIIARCLRYVGEPVDVRAGLLLQSRRRHRRTRRVRCPEKEYSCRFHRRTNLTLTS